MCGELDREADGLLFTTHLNETLDEISLVRSSFPWAGDYLETYERYGLVGERSVFSRHAAASDLMTLPAAARAGAVAHCPALERVSRERVVPAAAAS